MHELICMPQCVPYSEMNMCLTMALQPEYMDMMSGPNAANISSLCTVNGVNLVVSRDATGSWLHIYGSEQDCQATYLAISQMQASQSKVCIYPISIPLHLHVLIFGPCWVHVEEMMKKLGVTIHAPRDPYDAPELLHVEGTHAAVMATLTHLYELVQVLDPHIRCMVLPIEPKFYTKIIGRHGANLFKLLARHWVNIVIPDKEYSAQGIVIYGLEAHCYAARNDILEQISSSTNRSKTNKTSQIEVDAKQEQQQPEQQQPQQQQQQQPGQEQEEQEQQPEVDNVYESTTVTLDSRRLAIVERHRKDVGCMIRRRYKVRVVVFKSHEVVLKGQQDNCKEAKEYLESLFQVEKAVAVAREMRSFIVGKNGRRIRKMTVEHGVIINVPPKDNDDDLILVSGPHEDNVNKACKTLLDRVEKIRVANNKQQPPKQSNESVTDS